MNADELPFADSPIIVVGAARSGTKMLRGAIAAHDRVSDIPWDVNFVWKYGHYGVPHDELAPEQLTPEARRFIRGFFDKYWRPGCRVVEKTVSNTLRVPYVRAVFPSAQFVHLIRDGRDVAESAARMWRAPPDWARLREKLRAFPLAAVPNYATSYARSYGRRAFGQGQRVGSWGPRFVGIDEVSSERSILETCAIQWSRSIRAAQRDLAGGRVLEIRYEKLVTEPEKELARLLEFLDLPRNESHIARASEGMSAKTVGKHRRSLSDDEQRLVTGACRAELELLGYLPDGAEVVEGGGEAR